MTTLHDHLKKEADSFRMTDAEKAAMRARLASAMNGAGSPRRSVPSPNAWMFHTRSITVAALAVLLVVSTGTAYAAQGSLPGGVLYPVKVSVLEPIVVALATTPEAKAQANANIAATRVAEAQTLAARGALTPQVAQEISTNYEVHAQAALALADDVDGSSHTNSTTTTPAPAVAPAVVSAPATTTDADAVQRAARSYNFSVGMSVVSGDASTTPVLEKKKMTDTATTTPATLPPSTDASTTATSSEETFSGKLRATLSAQAHILEALHVQVQIRGRGGDEQPRRDEDTNDN